MSLLYFLKDLKKIKFNYKLGSKTWFGTGGNAQFFLIINSLKSLEYLLKIIPGSVPVFLIGAGSNILVRDGGIKGVTIKLGEEFKKIIFDSKKKILKIGGGCKDLNIAKYCYDNSIGGFEFLRGIPGTLGGNIRMNAGCFGNLISDKLIKCKIMTRNGKIIEFSKEQISFEYRKSSIPSDSIIVDAEFNAKIIKKEVINDKMQKITKSRILAQPINHRTGGSTFKNPDKDSAWKLIDKINFRGKKIGGANVSKKHTNFLINGGDASSLDLEMLGEEIKSNVKKKFNINLDWELIRIGDFKKIS